jgi:hypothetical protein
LPRFGEHTRVDISGNITRFNSLEIDESFFRIDSAHVHLASINTEQGIIAPFLRGVVGVLGRLPSDFLVGEPGVTVKPAICFVRGLDSVDMAALYRFGSGS